MPETILEARNLTKVYGQNTIFKNINLKVKEGEAVKAGQTIIILEAMKMESDVVAPVAGTVRGISVAKGASVSAGDVLCSIQ